MKLSPRHGFSVIEMITVILVLSMVLYGIFRILTDTVRNFTRQEESAFCTGEGVLLISQIKQDFERLIGRGIFPDHYEQALSAITFDSAAGILLFKILGSSGPEEISYTFEKLDRKVIRRQTGKELTLGQGRVADFQFTQHLLGTDGLVRSFPPDPAAPLPEPPPPADKKVLRAWGTFFIVIESPPGGPLSQKPVHQEYRFNVFPVRFNNELRSIWKTD